MIKEVTSELEKIKGTNEQVLGFANQMKTLEKILSNQKQRGILGEIQLENLLSNVLPPELFQMQYHFTGNWDSQVLMYFPAIIRMDVMESSWKNNFESISYRRRASESFL